MILTRSRVICRLFLPNESAPPSNRCFAAFAFNKLRDDKPKAASKYDKRNPKHKIVSGDLLIECKRPQFNLLKTDVGKHIHDRDLLASNGWVNRKSNGDYFTVKTMSRQMDPNEDSAVKTFKEAGISSELQEILQIQGFQKPTDIQAHGMRPILEGHNVLLAAETGCGKTLAYLLPLVQQIKEWKPYMEVTTNSPIGIIISPNRELAYQIAAVARELGKKMDFSTKVLIGGRLKRTMMNPVFESTDLLIATVGALSKLTTTGVYKLSQVRHVVLDEADTLVDDSFNERVKYLLRKIPIQYHCERIPGQKPEGAQLTLASATMPTSIAPVLQDIVEEESLVKITTPGLHRVLPNVTQKFIKIGRKHKPEELLKVVKSASASKAPLLIFSNKSSTCDWISMFLNENGVTCVNLNGDMPLVLRRGTFQKFQDGEVNALSTTDVSSRGLNTIRAEIVLNYDFPFYVADYIHRCGRTGRVGSLAPGKIINFVCGPIESRLVQKIESAIRKQVPLSHVNNNITKIIEDTSLRRIQQERNSFLRNN